MSRLILVLSVLVTLASGGAAPAAGRIAVIGQGSVERAPDMATIALGATTEARSAAAALRQNSAAMGRILDSLARAGIAEADIQTRGFSVSAVWNNRSGGSRTITGYRVQNRLGVRVRDLASLGGILDLVIQEGGNAVQGLSFGLQDRAAAEDEARRRAVADAKRRAETYAASAGVTLGPLVEITEGQSSAPGPVALREMAMSSAVPVAEGMLTIAASVSVVYEIAE